ncbi:MAG: hypothetical protein JXR63_08925 [Spirochaetales bacterium]|nr:hypothetical protein [Spirochaetales bacterium]
MRIFFFIILLLSSCRISELHIALPEFSEDALIEELLVGYEIYHAQANLGFFQPMEFPIPLEKELSGIEYIVLFPVYQLNGFTLKGKFPACGITPLDIINSGSQEILQPSYERGIFPIIFSDNLSGLKNLNPEKFCNSALTYSEGNPFSLNITKLTRDTKEGCLNRYSFAISYSAEVQIPEGYELISENPLRKAARGKIKIFQGIERFFVVKSGLICGVIAFFLNSNGELLVYDYYGEVSKIFSP